MDGDDCSSRTPWLPPAWPLGLVSAGLMWLRWVGAGLLWLGLADPVAALLITQPGAWQLRLAAVGWCWPVVAAVAGAVAASAKKLTAAY